MKKIIIALALLIGVQGQADAQFLKKLGNAIDKAAKTVDDVANTILGDTNSSSSQTSKTTKKSKPYQLGESKITIIGENPGVSMTKLHATRVYGSKDVILNMQLYNSTDEPWHFQTSIYICVAVDDNGNQFKNGGIDMGDGNFTTHDAMSTILDDTKFNMRLLFSHVNLDDTRLKRVEMNYVYHDYNYQVYNGTFRMDNVPITLLPSLKADGVYGEGKVLIGSTITSLPDAIPYMYDNYTTSQFTNNGKTYKMVTFTLDDEVMFKAISKDQTTISYICLDTPHVKFKVGENFYAIDNDLTYEDEHHSTPNANGDLTFRGLTLKREKAPGTGYLEIKRVYAGL
jgi:hypothetical protein